MEPKLPTPNIGPERSPVSYGQNFERPTPMVNPENAIEQSPERFEQRGEAASAAAVAAATPVLPSPVVAPTPMVTDASASIPVADDNPLVANDDDLIEKEWVDQAKKIIVQTKDDPYRREQEVAKLQADYLRKRYGKELGVS